MSAAVYETDEIGDTLSNKGARRGTGVGKYIKLNVQAADSGSLCGQHYTMHTSSATLFPFCS